MSKATSPYNTAFTNEHKMTRGKIHEGRIQSCCSIYEFEETMHHIFRYSSNVAGEYRV
jgi:hypothetical protein